MSVVTTLFAVLWLAVGAGPAQAQTPPIAPEASSLQTAGATFAVDVRVGSASAPVSDLFGVSFVLDYDPQHLSVVDDQAGPLLGSDVVSSTNDDASAGAFGVGVTRKSGAGGVNGNGVVWTLRFEVDDAAPPGQTLPFTITDVSANTPSGAPIPLDPRTLDVTVTNTAPTITGLSDQTIGEDGSTGALPFTVGDAETAASNLTVTATSGDQTLLPDGNLSLGGSGATRTIEVVPAPDEFGQATVTVTVDDGAKQTASTFTLTVNAVNDAPSTTLGGDRTVDEDAGPQTVGGFATFDPGPNESSQQAQDYLVSTENSSLFASGPNVANDGTLTFEPAPDQNGSAVVTVRVRDDGGTANGGTDLSPEEAFTITIHPINDAPTVADDSYTVVGGQTLAVSQAANGVLANDTDADGDALNASVVSGPAHGTLSGFENDGTFTYEPDAGFVGADTFTYEAADGNGGTDEGTVTVRMVSANAPVATVDSYVTNEGETLVVSAAANGVLGNDTDADGDPLAAQLVSGVAHGQLTFHGDGTFQYRPNADFSGVDSFVYEASDGTGLADQATVTIQVLGENDPPTISGLSNQTINEDGSTGALPFTVGDVETPPTNLSVTAMSSDQTLLPDGNLTLGGSGEDRTITATPASDQSGTAEVTVTVTDSRSEEASATFTLTVNAVNDAPTILASLPDGEIEIPGPPLELTGLQGGVFRDVDGDLTFAATSSNPSVVSVEESHVQDKATSSGSVMLRPVATGTAEITITASDGTTEVAAEPFTLTVVDAEEGREMPNARSRAMVRTNGNGATGVDFGFAGSDVTFRGVRQGGTVDVRFFGGTDENGAAVATGGESGATAGATEGFANVSPYRWEIDAGEAQFGAVDVGVRLRDADVTGVGDPAAVTVLVDSTGNGTFEATQTRFDDGGTPGDRSDDRLVAESLTALGTFRLASNSDQNPLPVELAGFTATVDGQAAVLRWRTATETSNAGFEVQHRRSATMHHAAARGHGSAGAWVQVGFVEGAGTTTEPQRYRFRVEELTPGTHRFRLRQVDTDGTATLTDVVTVTVEAERALRLEATGPNPVREATQFAFTVKQSGRATVTLYNVLGQEVRRLHDREATVGQRYTVDVSAADLPSGTYFVRLSAPSGTRTGRIVVLR